MREIHTITPTEMRVINRSAILALVRKTSPISRSTIAEMLGVSLPTVMRIIDDLVEEGLVRPLGITEWSGGRRRSLLEFNARSQVMIGAAVSATRVYCAAADLAGTVLLDDTRQMNGAVGEEAVALLSNALSDLLERGRAAGLNIRGIGVGVPGNINYERGQVCESPALGWHDLLLRDRLQARFELPVMVDDEAHLAALGEVWYGNGQNANSLVLLQVGDGIGAGMVLDGVIYRGAHQSAGKIGRLLPGREFLGCADTPDSGLENLASFAGASKRAKSALPVRDMIAAANAGEDWARPIVTDLVDYLTIAVSALAAAVDPDLLVLGGEDTASVAALLPLVSERIQSSLTNPPRLLASSMGNRAVVMGAVTNLLHNIGEFYTVRRMA